MFSWLSQWDSDNRPHCLLSMLSGLRGKVEQIQEGATSKCTQCTVFHSGTFSKISSYRRKEHTHTSCKNLPKLKTSCDSTADVSGSLWGTGKFPVQSFLFHVHGNKWLTGLEISDISSVRGLGELWSCKVRKTGKKKRWKSKEKYSLDF